MRKSFVWLSALLLAASLVACRVQEPPAEVLPTIAGIAVAEGLDSLVAALEAAELVEVFADPEAGPFTVFAPSEEAFATLLEFFEAADLEELIEEVTLEVFVGVLQYHVVAGTHLAEDLVGVAVLNTLSELFAAAQLEVVLVGESVAIQAVGSLAQVVEPDLLASNGVIHVIDTVLLPFVPMVVPTD